MKYFKTPKFLYEVLGKKQSVLEVLCTLLFALVGSAIIFLEADASFSRWQVIVAYLLIADVLAGCIANFTFGTNAFYANQPKNRLIFIAIHVHLIVIAWLLDEPIDIALLVWGYTIISAFIVNALKGKSIQSFIAANLLCYGLFLLIFLAIKPWFLMVSIFFMIKVMFSFAVDHYRTT